MFYAIPHSTLTCMPVQVKSEDYLSAAIDPVFEYGPAVCKHMNEDHAASLNAMVKHYTGLDIESGKMIRIDRLGFDMLCKSPQFGTVPCRLSFPRYKPGCLDSVLNLRGCKVSGQFFFLDFTASRVKLWCKSHNRSLKP